MSEKLRKGFPLPKLGPRSPIMSSKEVDSIHSWSLLPASLALLYLSHRAVENATVIMV